MAGGLRAPGRRALRVGSAGRRRRLSRPPLPANPSLGRLDFGDRFPESFFVGPVERVARELLGACLVSTVDGTVAAVVLTEVEAYGGAEDAASHAATRSGVTKRNRAMFGSPGRAYVYRSYGMHWCLNVVTGPEGTGQAVLLRGAWPIAGLDAMARRRRGRLPLSTGPGRLGEALGVSDALYGHDLAREPLVLMPGWRVEDDRVGSSGRIGVSVAAETAWRFYVRGAPGVSPHSRRPVEPPPGPAHQ